ncbi:MAG: VOC family protein [Gemmatimonadales bacterium]
MHVNHLDLQVSDVGAARRFFETHFGLRLVHQREGQLAMLEDDAGFSLGVSNLFGSPPPVYPPDFHLGFILSTEAEVRTCYDRLRAAGVPMRSELRRGGPNLYFMCLGPDSIMVEVRAPLDEAPATS